MVSELAQLMNVRWMPRQEQLLAELYATVTVIESAPGASKTTLLAAICLAALRSSVPQRVYVVEPNEEMCQAVEERLTYFAEKACR